MSTTLSIDGCHGQTEFFLDFFGLPVDDLTFFSGEGDADQEYLFLRKLILLEIFILFDLGECRLVFIQFEFKDEDEFLRFGDSVNATVVGVGFRGNVVAEQTEDGKEDVLEIAFVFVMDFIRNAGEKRFQGFPELFQISAFHGIRQLFAEGYHIIIRFP